MNNVKHMGSFYLIPSLLSADAPDSLSPQIKEVIRQLHHFFVENERSARRFFKLVDPSISIDDRHFRLINKHHPPDTGLLKQWLLDGLDVGVVSEAGYPCIADPGQMLVKAAHSIHARVCPLTGPNAMLLALAASGLNGQRFRFSGYLPQQPVQRIKVLRELEMKVQRTGETQLFMETPYRNNALLKDILQHCRPETRLCIAADLTAKTEFIRTCSIREWKKQVPDLHKRPAVFLMGR